MAANSLTDYPETARARTEWILAHRGEKNILDAWKPYAYFEEMEAGPDGQPIPTATVFLTNRECPYRCLMCDLWRNTLDAEVAPGAIAGQITWALERLPKFATGDARRAEAQIKLYNAGSFFDPRAIPLGDYAEIAGTVSGFRRVVVESHPAFVGKRCLKFQKLLSGRLEVAIGLETVHPLVLAKLNKRFTLAAFRRAAAFLADNDIDLRVFLLLRPPFMSEKEGLEWARRSLDTAFECGASVCCVIPTRGGNGAMEILAAAGAYAPPGLASLEAAIEYGLGLREGRVFADLWDIRRFFDCDCSQERSYRLADMNRTQQIPARVQCERCTSTL